MGFLWGLGEPYGVWEEPRSSNVALGGFYGGAMGSGGPLWGSYGVWGNPMGTNVVPGGSYEDAMGAGGTLWGLGGA